MHQRVLLEEVENIVTSLAAPDERHFDDLFVHMLINASRR
jgi:hypothetical protein